MVVEITLGGGNLESLRQYARYKLLGCGFAVAACNGYDWYRQAATVLLCQRLQGL